MVAKQGEHRFLAVGLQVSLKSCGWEQLVLPAVCIWGCASTPNGITLLAAVEECAKRCQLMITQRRKRAGARGVGLSTDQSMWMRFRGGCAATAPIPEI